MTTVPVALITAVASFSLSQGWKVFRPILRGRPPRWSALTQSGGMPSSHAAFSASIAMISGYREGFGSTTFALAAVVAAVVAHDAVKVRGSINALMTAVRRIAAAEDLEDLDLPETIGHSAREVAVGLLLAAVVATGCHLLLP